MKEKSGIVLITAVLILGVLAIGGIIVYFVVKTIMEMLPMVLLVAAILFGVIIVAKTYFTMKTGKMYDVPKEAEA